MDISTNGGRSSLFPQLTPDYQRGSCTPPHYWELLSSLHIYIITITVTNVNFILLLNEDKRMKWLCGPSYDWVSKLSGAG